MSNIHESDQQRIHKAARAMWIVLGRSGRPFTQVELRAAVADRAERAGMTLDVFVKRAFGYAGFDSLRSTACRNWVKLGLVVRHDSGFFSLAPSLVAEFASDSARDVPELLRDASPPEPPAEAKSEPQPSVVDQFTPGDEPVFAGSIDLAVLLFCFDGVTFWRKAPASATEGKPAQWRLFMHPLAPIENPVLDRLEQERILFREPSREEGLELWYRVATEAITEGNLLGPVTPWVASYFLQNRPPPADDAPEQRSEVSIASAEAALAQAVALFTKVTVERDAHDSVEACQQRMSELEEQLKKARHDLEKAQFLDARASMVQPFPRLMGQLRQDVIVLHQRREDEAIERIRLSIVAEAEALGKPFDVVAKIMVQRLLARDHGSDK